MIFTWLLLFTIAFQATFCCPLWTCSNQVSHNYCVYWGKDSNKIHIRTNLQKSEACYISDLTYIPSSPQFITTVYSSSQQRQFCSDEQINLLYTNLKCQTFCKGQECNIKNFINLHESQFKTPPGKYSNWQECSTNSDCVSQKCSCTPIAQRDKGRCTTSVRDSIFHALYTTVCERNLTQIQTNQDIKEEICSYYILSEMGHLLTQLFINENNKQLTCLQSFKDYPLLMDARKVGESLQSIFI